MWRSVAFIVFVGFAHGQLATPRNGNELVKSVLTRCSDMDCVRGHVLGYFDYLLGTRSDSRAIQNMDQAIFKRAARILKTFEFRFKLPEFMFGNSELVYNPIRGLNVMSHEAEERALGLKKKLLLPILLLFKLKMKALMPLFVALIGLKATKALILSKIALAVVLGFVIYQFLNKSGMPMPMSMMTAVEPPPPPVTMYGPPSTSPSSSYEPGWEPSGTGPYSRLWSSGSSSSSLGSESAQSLAYSSYYPGSSGSSTSSP